jgi:hypothetical protein
MLRPLSFDIQKQELEIEAAQVIPGSVMWQHLIHDNVLTFNILVSSIIAFLKLVFKVKQGKLMQSICFALSLSHSVIFKIINLEERKSSTPCAQYNQLHSMFWC